MRIGYSNLEEPFPAKVTVRSQEHERLIIREATSLGCLDSAKAGF